MAHSPPLTKNFAQLTGLRIQNDKLKETLQQVQESLDENKDREETSRTLVDAQFKY